MIAALTASELSTLLLVLGVLVLLLAAWMAYAGHRLPVAAFVAVVGLLLVLLAS